MILAVDVQYEGDNAVVAGIIFKSWGSGSASRELVVELQDIAPYEPGAFYKRELPCILALLQQVSEPLECIVVDGFVTLGRASKPGLGMHLYNALDQQVPVIGVAKKSFKDTPDECALLRGKSEKPLYITCAGVELKPAKDFIAGMSGSHRLPLLLKRADQLCRGINA